MLTNLIDTQSLGSETIARIWSLVPAAVTPIANGQVALSFQGPGTRTRTTFVQALSHLGLNYIDLPNFLATTERVQDLAGYLDPFYSLYIVRFHDHDKIKSFSYTSRRPVINAMSSLEHPCEALSDAYWFHTAVKPLNQARIVLWGPVTNVLRSWANVAKACGANLDVLTEVPKVFPQNADLVITDGWPHECGDQNPSLTKNYLAQMGLPILLPTPPFTIGQELDFDPLTYAHFAGYDQKIYLLKVQIAIIRYVIEKSVNH